MSSGPLTNKVSFIRAPIVAKLDELALKEASFVAPFVIPKNLMSPQYLTLGDIGLVGVKSTEEEKELGLALSFQFRIFTGLFSTIQEMIHERAIVVGGNNKRGIEIIRLTDESGVPEPARERTEMDGVDSRADELISAAMGSSMREREAAGDEEEDEEMLMPGSTTTRPRVETSNQSAWVDEIEQELYTSNLVNSATGAYVSERAVIGAPCSVIMQETEDFIILWCVAFHPGITEKTIKDEIALSLKNATEDKKKRDASNSAFSFRKSRRGGVHEEISIITPEMFSTQYHKYLKMHGIDNPNNGGVMKDSPTDIFSTRNLYSIIYAKYNNTQAAIDMGKDPRTAEGTEISYGEVMKMMQKMFVFNSDFLTSVPPQERAQAPVERQGSPIGRARSPPRRPAAPPRLHSPARRRVTESDDNDEDEDEDDAPGRVRADDDDEEDDEEDEEDDLGSGDDEEGADAYQDAMPVTAQSCSLECLVKALVDGTVVTGMGMNAATAQISLKGYEYYVMDGSKFSHNAMTKSVFPWIDSYSGDFFIKNSTSGISEDKSSAFVQSVAMHNQEEENVTKPITFYNQMMEHGIRNSGERSEKGRKLYRRYAIVRDEYKANVEKQIEEFNKESLDIMFKMHALSQYVLRNRRLRVQQSRAMRAVVDWIDQYRDEKTDDIFVDAVVVKIPEYSALSSYLMARLSYACEYQSVDPSMLKLYMLVESTATNAFDRIRPNKMIILVCGENSSGKSYTIEKSLSNLITSTWQNYSQESSDQAYSTGKTMSCTIEFYGEMQAYMVNAERNLHGKELDKLNTLKDVTSTGYHQRLVLKFFGSDENKQRGNELIHTERENPIIGCTNQLRNHGEAWPSRGHIITVLRPVDKSFIVNSHRSSTIKNRGLDSEMSRLTPKCLQSICALLSHTINARVIPDINTDVSDAVFLKLMCKLVDKQVPNAEVPRHQVKISSAAKENCRKRVVIDAYIQEGGIFADQPLNFKKQLPVLAKMLYTTFEDTANAIISMSEEYFNPCFRATIEHMLQHSLKIKEHSMRALIELATNEKKLDNWSKALRATRSTAPKDAKSNEHTSHDSLSSPTPSTPQTQKARITSFGDVGESDLQMRKGPSSDKRDAPQPRRGGFASAVLMDERSKEEDLRIRVNHNSSEVISDDEDSCVDEEESRNMADLKRKRQVLEEEEEEENEDRDAEEIIAGKKFERVREISEANEKRKRDDREYKRQIQAIKEEEDNRYHNAVVILEYLWSVLVDSDMSFYNYKKYEAGDDDDSEDEDEEEDKKGKGGKKKKMYKRRRAVTMVDVNRIPIVYESFKTYLIARNVHSTMRMIPAESEVEQAVANMKNKERLVNVLFDEIPINEFSTLCQLFTSTVPGERATLSVRNNRVEELKKFFEKRHRKNVRHMPIIIDKFVRSQKSLVGLSYHVALNDDRSLLLSSLRQVVQYKHFDKRTLFLPGDIGGNSIRLLEGFNVEFDKDDSIEAFDVIETVPRNVGINDITTQTNSKIEQKRKRARLDPTAAQATTPTDFYGINLDSIIDNEEQKAWIDPAKKDNLYLALCAKDEKNRIDYSNPDITRITCDIDEFGRLCREQTLRTLGLLVNKV